MSKTATQQLSKELLEQIYEEVEQRVEGKFLAKIEALEAKVDKYRQEADRWKRKYFKEQENSQNLQNKLSLAKAEIKGLKKVIEKQNVRIASLEKELYGKTKDTNPKRTSLPKPEKKRSRGRPPGDKGNGRRKHPNLDTEECIHDLSASERVCNICGNPYEDIGEKTSEEIDISFRLVRTVHIRKTVKRTCCCKASPVIKTAPAPPKLFKGSAFSTEFWQYIIYDKYHLHRPVNRTLMLFESYGISLTQSTFTNGFKRLHERQVFKPLVGEIAARIKTSSHLQMDETSWKIFQEIEGKKGFQHWLWVALSADCCLYTIDPSRSREVALRFIGDGPVIVTSDMFSAYKDLGDNVKNSWCWAHVRRHILKLSSYSTLKSTVQSWIDKADWLYHLNNLRLAAKNDLEFQLHDTELRSSMNDFIHQAKRYARRTKHEEAKKVFKMISKNWNGLSLFVDLPAIPMDNNASENALRGPVVARKSYLGSGSCWSGEFAADLFTIFKTIEMNGIDPRTWFLEYLTAAANNGGYAPPNYADFLPWNSPPVHDLHS